MQVSAGEIYRLRIEYFDNVGEATVSFQAGMMDEERLASSLKHARNVIVCAGFNSSTEGEGFDRPFALSYGQEYLINKVASLHDNVAVVVNAGGGIDSAIGAECTSYFDGMVSGAGGWKGPCRNHYGQAFAKWQTTSQHRGKMGR